MWKFACLVLIFAIDLIVAQNIDYETPNADGMVLMPNRDGKFELVKLDEEDEAAASETHFTVKMILHTRQNKEEGKGQRIDTEGKKFNESLFNSNHPTRILAHGWFNDGHSYFCQKIKDAFLEIGDYNVIIADWSEGAKYWNYLTSKDQVIPVGTQIGELINRLYDEGYLKSYLDVNIIGHSLGAHIAGVAGRIAKSHVNIIYGLDPAGPFFSLDRPWERLNKKDAQLTITLRTNMGLSGLGYNHPLGMIDFVANGGKVQPACGSELSVYYRMCSHSAAYKYFIESLKSDKFASAKCADFDDMKSHNCFYNGAYAVFVGENFDFSTPHGFYYFETSATTPYGLGTAPLKSYVKRKWSIFG